MVSGGLILPTGKGTVSPLLKSFWVYVHLGFSFLGIAALSLASLGGLFYLVQERQIKGKKFGFFYRRLPSLEQLDALNYRCLTMGFPLLTAGIIIGSLYSQYTLGSFFSFDPKEILTLIAWMIYAVLLHERLTVGWRGRRAALLALCGFGVLIITFVGASLWFAGYHSFANFSGQP
jgi:cytochrome c-type biogenesis protein CcsB